MSKRLIAKIFEAVNEEPTPRLLAFDPAPAGLVDDRSLRRTFKNEWARIRARHFKENGTGCALCQIVEPEENLIEGHEIYSFPSPKFVKLERILFVCRKCHYAIHLERTRNPTSRCSPGYIREIEEHYCKINGISEKELAADYKRMKQRSFEIREFCGGAAATPRIDFGPYQSGVDETLKRKRSRVLDDDDDDGFEMYPDHECLWDVGRD